MAAIAFIGSFLSWEPRIVQVDPTLRSFLGGPSIWYLARIEPPLSLIEGRGLPSEELRHLVLLRDRYKIGEFIQGAPTAPKPLMAMRLTNKPDSCSSVITAVEAGAIHDAEGFTNLAIATKAVIAGIRDHWRFQSRLDKVGRPLDVDRMTVSDYKEISRAIRAYEHDHDHPPRARAEIEPLLENPVCKKLWTLEFEKTGFWAGAQAVNIYVIRAEASCERIAPSVFGVFLDEWDS